MRLVWRALALKDRERIMEHIATANPDAAIALDEAFENKAQQTQQTPMLYKAGRFPGTHEIVVRPNYVMVYRVTADYIEFIRVLHSRQQWP
ncbi:type II toxin-antitoxin system mRNA interferase toxin, RelE/StbE family [Pseudomonas alkylphenolica]|jgi:toxin ParE1/3/4|uniref:Type II toxin-antitoxin system mRNA interferase toxin, RelE/StbE family n=1 Tax=Pseudomonas alkylphenolica TaxID=237609 RepID=A0A6I6GMH6_9PSED|nr:type II toxin-antitoxin system RelE/ParE family toxin [Pseudomonas alkylphenolica]QGW75510.1 type II toxin-antitoxin system mRNA interferase toxin, RelE/StbE family [Pseudomonas alkylphenolica]